MNKYSRWLFLVSACLVATLVSAETTATSPEDVSLDTALVQYTYVPELHEFDGSIEAINRSTLSAQTSGIVETIHYDVDDMVEKGSVIVRIRSTNQRAGLEQAKAGLNQSEANLRQNIASLSEIQARLKAAKASYEEAVTRAAEAQTDFNRISEIYQKRLIPKAEYDRAQTTLKTSRSQVEAARAQMDAGNAQLKATQAQLEGAKANLVASRAQVEQAGEQLGYTTLIAPYSGIVTERHIELGETVNPGTPIMTGISLDQLRVIVEVPQRLITTAREHQQVYVRLDGSDKPISVKSITFFPYAYPKTNAFKVRIDLQDGVDGLYPGMFVKAAFLMGMERVLSVPKEAVVIRSEVTGIYVQKKDGSLAFRQIRVGLPVDANAVRVLSGLDDGETVVLDPVLAAITLKRLAKEAGSDE